ncbi:Hsp20/alpha crystallin family protein [Fulvivirgaceae bacterium BMA12]|uniref:Hsp20/alpha crystallin family protein n=1 Tax=Agaribacillus aureus TaxID=3051825 RepID=A0ABT8L1N6_9BACT|nr:Hsp20/alpha crystallin family protein [Fulvivirgaceae bacterium BMA12]
MRFERDGIDQIMLNIDVNNTINGGMIQTGVDIENYEDEVIVTIKVPSISSEKLRLRVYNNLLLVMHKMNYEVDLNGQVIPLTQILRKIPISPKAIVDDINAVYRDGELIVFIPRGAEVQKMHKSKDIKIK